MINVPTISFSQRGAFYEENILGVELCAAREVIRAGYHTVIDYQDLVMHEIVAPGGRVGR